AAFNGMPVDFTIYDAFGNSAYSASVTGGGTQTFDISAYANGVYMVEALTGQERITSRFLIAR
ncbi:MAG TPA: T9SS type A sorting domain-containing protein, partial [Flavobacteriales bacterium]|nr:T9SS type A sorting domain-containing protein [Flavobacteriales bacterium]